MADKLYITIMARKEVDTIEQGRALYDLVKEKLADRPDIVITGTCQNHFKDEE